jgi:hypothetical protein
VIINDNFLRLIWEDIHAMHFPPGYTDLPPNQLGLAREGKLKAAQWPNVCLALIPSLTREWSRYTGGDQRKWLLHFFHLIGLTRILFLSSVSQDDSNNFKRHALAYVEGIKTLFPSHRLKPNHHYLLHLGDMMQSLGPMRSWWSFPYERLNGEIQRTKTNNISGKFFYRNGS